MAGKQQKNSFAHRVMVAAVGLGAECKEITRGSVSQAMGLTTWRDDKRAANALIDLTKAGRLVRQSRGVYGLQETTPRPSPDKKTVMYRILRARRQVTIADLMELAGASRSYTQEWLRTMQRHDVVVRGAHGYRLINDPGPQPPRIDDNAAKLRQLRAAKRAQVMKDLDLAFLAINQARQSFLGMDEEGGEDGNSEPA